MWKYLLAFALAFQYGTIALGSDIVIPKECMVHGKPPGGCGWATAATLCHYFNIPEGKGIEFDTRKQRHSRRGCGWGYPGGMCPDCAAKDFRARGIRFIQDTNLTVSDLKDICALSYPVGIGLDTPQGGHCVVLVGVVDDQIHIVGNMQTEYRSVPAQWFDGWAFAIMPHDCALGDRLKAIFNRRRRQPNQPSQPSNPEGNPIEEPTPSKPETPEPPKPQPPTPAPEPSAPPAWAQQIQISINNANDGIKGVTDILKNHEARLKSLETKPAVPPVSPSKWEWQPK